MEHRDRVFGSKIEGLSGLMIIRWMWPPWCNQRLSKDQRLEENDD